MVACDEVPARQRTRRAAQRRRREQDRDVQIGVPASQDGARPRGRVAPAHFLGARVRRIPRGGHSREG